MTGVQTCALPIFVGAGVDYLLQMLSLVFQSSSMNNITLESPGYTQAAHIFHNNGLTVTPGTMDKSGLSTSSITPESSIVYVTPSHQFPLGTVMPYGRRVELLTWAKASADRYIIEDDHDSEFRYRGKPIPADRKSTRLNSSHPSSSRMPSSA